MIETATVVMRSVTGTVRRIRALDPGRAPAARQVLLGLVMNFAAPGIGEYFIGRFSRGRRIRPRQARSHD
jgi:hypothetical protein